MVRRKDDSKESIMAAVRRALSHPVHSNNPGRPAPPSNMAIKPAVSPDDEEGLVRRFQSEIALLGSVCLVAQHYSEAQEYVTNLVRDRGFSRIAVSDSPILEAMGAGAWFDWPATVNSGITLIDRDGASDQNGNDPTALRTALLNSELGITGASFGLADTGTIAITTGDEKNRLVSLVTTIHVAIVGRGQLLPDLPSLLARLQSQGDLSQAITLITGPSRTADIELTLTIGVHGPKELHVIVVPE